MVVSSSLYQYALCLGGVVPVSACWCHPLVMTMELCDILQFLSAVSIVTVCVKFSLWHVYTSPDVLFLEVFCPI